MDLDRKKDTLLPDFVRFSWKASRGLIDKPENHVSYWSDRLPKTGKLTPEQVTKLADFISNRTVEAHKRFLSTVDRSISQAVAKIANLTQEEVSKIEDKLQNFSNRVDGLK